MHEELGLQYLRARYYDVENGCFTSKDTYAGDLTDILSQNRYTYAQNNPINYCDPSGHKSKANTSNIAQLRSRLWSRQPKMFLDGRRNREDICSWAINFIRNDERIIVDDIEAWHYLVEISNIDEMIAAGEYHRD